MISVSKAKLGDLPGIRQLMLSHGKFTVDAGHLHYKDLSLVASIDGKIIGFLWLGLMAKGTLAYIDKFCVDPEYAHHKIGSLLAQEAFKHCLQRGVKECFGVICQDEHHEKSALNALRFALGSIPHSYTLVSGNLLQMKQEIESLGV